MDFNLPKWLKDDLCLRHMSEADMHNLVYHPRHGSLCRRLVKFLTESTLCSKRYPNVYAQEEHEKAEKDLHEKTQLSRELLSKLEAQTLTTKNVQSELDYLRRKHNCLLRIEELLKASTAKIEEMVNRPNIALVETGRCLENPEYLGNISLKSLYTNFSTCYQNYLKESDKITRRDFATVNDEHHALVNNAQRMHDSINKLLTSILEACNKNDCDVKLFKTNVVKLKALTLPQCDEIEKDYDSEEKQLCEQRVGLLEELRHTDQQVKELAQQISDSKAEMNKRFKAELEKDLLLLRTTQQLEASLFSS